MWAYFFFIVNNLDIYTFLLKYCNIRYVFFILCGNKDYYYNIYKWGARQDINI